MTEIAYSTHAHIHALECLGQKESKRKSHTKNPKDWSNLAKCNV